MTLKYKRLYIDSPDLEQPKEGNAGIDLKAYGDYTIAPGERILINTGIAFEIPKGYVGIVTARSGLRTKLHIDQRVGIIDSNYRGEIFLDIENNGNESFEISTGDRIVQMVIVPYFMDTLEDVRNLSESNRGTNGLGSSGIKENLSWL